ncbi:MAG: hypothetical protein CML24_14620 [Rhizobiales bacterium]|nr:hypothetical protein [Hyphomicrobiales bacterium]
MLLYACVFVSSAVTTFLLAMLFISGDPSIATMLAGFGGAALGGLIAWLTARQTDHRHAEREKRRIILAERAQALRVMLIAMELANRLFTIRNMLKRAIDAGNPAGPFADLRPLSGHESRAPSFAPEDFVQFINADRPEVVNDCLMLYNRVDAIDAAFRAYGETRLQLQDLSAETTFGGDGVARTVYKGENAQRANFLIKTLNQLIFEVHKDADEYHHESLKLFHALSEAFKSYFQEDANFTLSAIKPAETPATG